MRLTILGSGDAAGFPKFGCECQHCQHARAHQIRRRSSCAMIQWQDQRFLIDAGVTDLAERFDKSQINGFFITHFHPDHVQGLFHLRWGSGEPIDCYAPDDPVGCADLYKHSGILNFIPRTALQSWQMGELTITTLPMNHSKLTLGYLFQDLKDASQSVAYCTDTKGLSDEVITLLKDINLNTLIIDTSTTDDNASSNHNSYSESLELAKIIGAKKLVLTHIGHDLHIWLKQQQANNQLPEHVLVAEDNSVVFASTEFNSTEFNSTTSEAS